MKRELDIEYCDICEDIYATYSLTWRVFGNNSAETSNSSDRTFNCPRCNNLIKRYEGFLTALERRDSDVFVEDVIDNIEDLREQSLEVLRVLMRDFTVPSFSVGFKKDDRYKLEELKKKRYVELTVSETTVIVTLNAYKLRLLDNTELLLRMSNQRSFITNPENTEKSSDAYRRRAYRQGQLINDFTPEDKQAILGRFSGKCAFTGKEVPLQFDHVIPIAIGHGGTTKANMLPIWQRINSSKGARNVFEWYEENGERFNVCPDRFRKAIDYIADLNEMSYEDYREYVYECHANPNDILTEVR